MIRKIPVQTKSRVDLINVTREIEKFISGEKILSGQLFIFVPHTTAGITINEQADPDVITDIKNSLNNLIPRQNGYLHMEGNSDAHIKASLIGASTQIVVEKGKLLLGTWQGIFFCEFDGPRQREMWVKIL